MRLHTRNTIKSHATGYFNSYDSDWALRTLRHSKYPIQRRIGTIILRYEDAGVSYAQADAEDAGLIPSERASWNDNYFSDPPLLDESSYENEMKRTHSQKIRSRLATLAMPLVGIATVETTMSGNLLHDVAGAAVGLAAGGVGKYAGSQVHLSAMDRRLGAIDKKFESGVDNIRLPYEASTSYLQSDEVFDEFISIDVDGIETTVLRRDILEKIGNWKMDHWRYAIHLDDKPSNLTVKLNTSLWEEFKDDKVSFRGFWEEDSTMDKAAEFIRDRDVLAQKAGVELVASEAPFKKRLSRRERRKKAASYPWLRSADDYDFNNWQDARYTKVRIPPAVMVTELLKQSKNPGKLWGIIEPKLVSLVHEIEANNESSTELEQLKGVRDHTASNEEKLLSEIEQMRVNIHESQLRQILQCIEMAAIGMRVNEIEEYAVMRESLLGLIAASERAEEQGEAIALVDTAFNAFVQNLPADADESSRLGKCLETYLNDSMQFLTHSDGNIRHIYDGLRKKFPELRLPAEMKR